MLSHSDLATICSNVYAGPWSASLALDVRDDYLPRTGELVVAVRGTDPASAINWIEDVSALPRWVPGIGFLHSGFAGVALECWADAAPKMRTAGLITYTGHSMGAAAALIMAGLHAVNRSAQPFRVVAVAPPRPCLAVSSRLSWLVRRGVEAVSYARDGDVVPDLPLAPLYRQPVTPTMLEPRIADPIAAHAAAASYVAGIKGLGV